MADDRPVSPSLDLIVSSSGFTDLGGVGGVGVGGGGVAASGRDGGTPGGAGPVAGGGGVVQSPAASAGGGGGAGGGGVAPNAMGGDVSGGGRGVGGGGGGGIRRSIGALMVKALCIVGGALVLRKLTKRQHKWDHVKSVAQALCGEKFSSDQAARDPLTYFNLRLTTCPALTLADGTRVLYFEQAFWRTPERPYRQRFYVLKPCTAEEKCDVRLDTCAVRDIDEYKNFCDRSATDRPSPPEIRQDVAEHLMSVYLSKCERHRNCLYEGATPPTGFPNNWGGASKCTSELTIMKNGEIHCWDRAYDEKGEQVWGVRTGPYVFKPKSSQPPAVPRVEPAGNNAKKPDDKGAASATAGVPSSAGESASSSSSSSSLAPPL
ncbi:hypothetical protein CBR_g30803 [Chara braunii]|uniref:Uncharacterized protein n=1 Tax=Chara braunii TaxID=69332 RepID=A0A388JXN7_CHABU|nr:hypothetical protein CBR_g30803 [Chara braunii]|eukprot:GBG62483.1 hypothetical protein CBR_g30803 [Chara braunii]